MQNSFGPRNATWFCISTRTAPCAKPSQKLTAAVPIALSGAAVQSSTRSPVVLGPKFVSVAARGAPATVHPFNFMAVLPLHAANAIAEWLKPDKCHDRIGVGK